MHQYPAVYIGIVWCSHNKLLTLTSDSDRDSDTDSDTSVVTDIRGLVLVQYSTRPLVPVTTLLTRC